MIQNQHNLAFLSGDNVIQKTQKIGTGASVHTAGERVSGMGFKAPNVHTFPRHP